MEFSEYVSYDAVGLAELVRNGEATPSELVAAAADRMNQVNPTVNAVIRSQVDRAQSQAESSSSAGPFGGVPILIKDLVVEAGDPVCFGSSLFRDYVGETSSVFMERVKGAGFIEIGRTNTPEFGLLPITEPQLYGPTRNPWSVLHSPGGSSGGAAAAVAAGIVPMAQASDGGGSIRIPASNCGLFGLKPSRGRTARFPASPADYLSVELSVSRSVRDSAAMLDVVHGRVPGDEYWAPEPQRPYLNDVDRDPDTLTIAFTTHDFRGDRVHPQVEAAVTDTANLLESLGHNVVEDRPDMDGDAMAHAFLDVWASLAGSLFELVLEAAAEQKPAVRRMRAIAGDYRTMQMISKLDARESGRPGFEPFTWKLAKRSLGRSQAELIAAETTLQTMSHTMGAFLGKYDAILMPVLGSPPVRTGAFDQSTPWDELIKQLFRYVAFTPLANFSGLPAMSVPLWWTPSGLPVGSHFMGRFGDESTLLRLAGQLERARPWFDRLPDIS
jgi:amidase